MNLASPRRPMPDSQATKTGRTGEPPLTTTWFSLLAATPPPPPPPPPSSVILLDYLLHLKPESTWTRTA
ncbi:hypothetical protein E2C01_085068 [Portunus trituberculatus]|uniref:Uncharacterized protein n=1 Tax=Portunus trituberculatus TaxID=210409 RepID=A0A5B7IWY9_PORTR|nr:hypothetical protein [Portunus trituberculatus]